MNDTLLALDRFEPTREAGLARLDAFVPYAAAHYAKHRNTDGGAGAPVAVSGLSPYLRYRLLTEAEVIHAVLDRHSLEASQKFIQEVIWRTYWKGWLQMRPTVWTDYLNQLSDQTAVLEEDHKLHERYQKATQGLTGIEGFDDWAKHLVNTGYLHNHARMWFASIWIFTLRLPWVLGADFFLKHLLDGDPASNTLSWRWVAGIQTQGKTYLATRENIERFTNGRYSPKGLATEALPIEASPPPKPMALPPLPDLDEAMTQPSLCVVHEDDIELAEQYRAHSHCRGVVWVGPEALNDSGQGKRSEAFFKQAIKAARLPDETMTNGLDPTDLESMMSAAGARQLVMAEPPVGSPVAQYLSQCSPRFLVTLRRRYDNTLWPLATKGFFPFKEKVLVGSSLTKAIG